jgi:DNA-binding GntR family transcriptional regulator
MVLGLVQKSDDPAHKLVLRFCQSRILAPISIRDIAVLECFVVDKVAQSANHEQIEELAAMVRLEEDPGARLSDILTANSTFHLRLAELSANQRVENHLALVLCYVRRLDTICTQNVPGWIGHKEILTALREHQAEAAKLAMARHIDLSRDKMLRLFGA